MIWITSIILVFIASEGACDYGSPCELSDKLPGMCVPVVSCKPAYDFFEQIKKRNATISGSERQEIQELHCGTFRNQHHICCLESSIQLNPNGLKILENEECGLYTHNRVAHAQEGLLSGYPWMALFIYDDERDPFKCTGSLISEQYILTAAHCIKGKEHSLLKIRLGEHRKSTAIDCIKIGERERCAPPAIDVDIAEFILHELYHEAYNDIALIRLQQKIEPQSHIKPICLPIYNDLRAKYHSHYVIAGWGKTETGNSSDVLMVAAIPSVDLATCQSQLQPYGFRYNLTESHLCAGAKNLVDTCRGDSGGPLGYSDMYDGRPRFVQYGIVSLGIIKCGQINVPGVYTNVSYFMQWITDHIKD